MSAGKCLNCSKVIGGYELEVVPATDGAGNQWRTLSLLCPSCKTVVSAQIDPLALKKEATAEMSAALAALDKSVGKRIASVEQALSELRSQKR